MTVFKVTVTDATGGIHVCAAYESYGATTDREEEITNDIAGVVADYLRHSDRCVMQRLTYVHQEEGKE